MIYYAPVRLRKGERLIFENRKLEIKENYNSYNEIGWRNPSFSEEKFLAKRIRAHDGCLGIGRL